jgi:hypothetical protein
MAGTIAEAGAAEEAAESLILERLALTDHGNAKVPSRDAPMRAGVCREEGSPFMVHRIRRFHLGGFGCVEEYYVRHEQAPAAGP